MPAYYKFLIILLVFGCKRTAKKDYGTIKESSDLMGLSDSLQKNPALSTNVDLNLVTGLWGENIDENASFIIKKDSLYNIDHYTSTKYFIRNDSFYTIIEGEQYASKIILLNTDSLWLNNDNEVHKYVRFKN